MKYSIIIPIYNTADYLERCVESILRQTYQDFEVILVDNNSTDNSPQIIAEYVKKYPKKIFGYQCKAPGAAAARNLGVKKATGDYICLVDSDDYVTDNYLEKINEKVSAGAEMVIINVKGVDSDLSLKKWTKDIKRNFILTGPGPYCAIMKKELITKNHIHFREGIIYEDTAVMGSLILYTDKITAVKEPLYIIEPRPGSVMRQQTWNPEIGECVFTAINDLCDIFKRHQAFEQYHDELEQACIVAMLYVVPNCLLHFKESKPYYKRIRRYLKQNFPTWRKNKYIRRHYSLKIKIFMLLNYFELQWLIRLIARTKIY